MDHQDRHPTKLVLSLGRISHPSETRTPLSSGTRVTAYSQPGSDVQGDGLPVSWCCQRIIARLVTRSRQQNSKLPQKSTRLLRRLKTMPIWSSSSTCLIRSSLNAVRLTGLRRLSSTARLETPHTDHFQVPCASSGNVIVRSASFVSPPPFSSSSANADMVSASTMS